jgi:hypothetical protein
MTLRPRLLPARRQKESILKSWLRVIGRTIAPLLATLVGAGIVLGAAWLMGGNVY